MLKVGMVGATGIVGEVFIQLLEERNFPLAELRPFASEQSEGIKIKCQNREWQVQTLKDDCFAGLDLVFFSSGDEISREWAPKALAAGAFAVDNSAAFRMDPLISLIVPEVNGHLLPNKIAPAIIANPNCSTIQLVVALKPLADAFGLREVKVSTYQAASGAGKAAMSELKNQMQQFLANEPISHKEFVAPLAMNCIPQIGSMQDDGFCTEEKKIMLESRKILGLPELRVSAFTVRIPTLVGHAECAWVTLNKNVELNDVLTAMKNAPGLDLTGQPYPMVKDCQAKNPVFIGRLHRDLSDPSTWIMWIVADNLRKGAALNGIQIAEQIFDING